MMQAPAFRNGKNDEARDAMIATFDALPRHAHGRKEIEKLLDKHRREWHLLAQTTSSDLIEYLQTLHLSVIDLTGEGHSQERVRYSWRDPTVFDVAQSLGKSAYISHQSAAFLHGIADNPGQPVFVNIEQSPKDKPDGELSQVGIDRAFKSKQRQSAFSYTFRTWRIIVLSGKNTGRLGVVPMKISAGGIIDVTDLERTLVDLAVRPVYGGGVGCVLEAYRRAQPRVSVHKIVTTLRRLDHMYPYHQAIGFYMERAGFDAKDCDRLRRLGMTFKFYLCHGMGTKAYDPHWCLYHPKGT